MQIEILEKCVTATNSFKKGEVADIRGADAEALVKAGKAKYTDEAKKIIANTEKVLKARAEAKAKAK